MAFTGGINVPSIAVEYATASYVASAGGTVFTNGKDASNVSVDHTTGNCIAGLGGLVFTAGKNVSVPQTESGMNYVAAPYLPKVFVPNGNVVANFHSRLLAAGDTGIDISIVGYVADFHTNKRIVDMLETVYFYDDTFGSETLRWRWTMGDGQVLSSKNPTHAFNRSGWYDIKLETWSVNEEYSSVIKNNYIHVLAIPDGWKAPSSVCLIKEDHRTCFLLGSGNNATAGAFIMSMLSNEVREDNLLN